MSRRGAGAGDKTREVVEALMVKFGGAQGLANTIYENINDATSQATKEKFLTLALRLVAQAEDLRGGIQDYTDVELDSELRKMMTRFLTYMPEDEYRAVIKKTEELRARGSVQFTEVTTGG